MGGKEKPEVPGGSKTSGGGLEFGQIWWIPGKLGRNSPPNAPIVVKLNQTWPSSARMWPEAALLANVGRSEIEIGRAVLIFCRTRPCWPTLVETGPKLAKYAPISATPNQCAMCSAMCTRNSEDSNWPSLRPHLLRTHQALTNLHTSEARGSMGGDRGAPMLVGIPALPISKSFASISDMRPRVVCRAV